MRNMVLFEPNPQKSASTLADAAAFHIEGPFTSTPRRVVNDTNVISCTAFRSSLPSSLGNTSLGMMLNISPIVVMHWRVS